MNGTVAVIDYGICNVNSVEKAFRKVGADVRIVQTPAELESCGRWVLPGVGTFEKGMSNLKERGFVGVIRSGVRAGRPFLGICLGMQLLGVKGYEGAETEGLGLIAGEAVPLEKTPGLRLPHMGWNDCAVRIRGSLVDGGGPSPVYYFLHSYRLAVEDPAIVSSECDYGRPFAASIEKGNIFACQFHPEKSQRAGLAVLERFLSRTGTV